MDFNNDLCVDLTDLQVLIAEWLQPAENFANFRGDVDDDNTINNIDFACFAKVWTGPDEVPPSVPQNLLGNAPNFDTVALSWSASSDNFIVAGYKIYRNGTQCGTTAQLTYTDTGLEAQTTYTYTVSAYDNQGNESAQSSPPRIIETPEEVPPLPSLICKIQAGTSYVTVRSDTNTAWNSMPMTLYGTGSGYDAAVYPTVTSKMVRTGSFGSTLRVVGTAAGSSSNKSGLAAASFPSSSISPLINGQGPGALQEFTLEAWIKFAPNQDTRDNKHIVAFGRRDTGAPLMWIRAYTPSGYQRVFGGFRPAPYTHDWNSVMHNNGTQNVFEWNHYCLIFDKNANPDGTGTLTLYLNGQIAYGHGEGGYQIGSNAANSLVPADGYLSADQQYLVPMIGFRNNFTDQWDGWVDDVRLSSKVILPTYTANGSTWTPTDSSSGFWGTLP